MNSENTKVVLFGYSDLSVEIFLTSHIFKAAVSETMKQLSICKQYYDAICYKYSELTPDYYARACHAGTFKYARKAYELASMVICLNHD